MLKLYKKEEVGCLTVVLAGEMDTITSVRAEREIGVVSVYRKVVLDMTDVTYVTSAGIRVLVGIRKRMTPGAKLELINGGQSPIINVSFEVDTAVSIILIRPWS